LTIVDDAGPIAYFRSLESSSMPTHAIGDDRQIASRCGRHRFTRPRNTPVAKIRAGKTLIAALLCLFVLGVPAAPADDKPKAPPTDASAIELPSRVETRHSIETAAGKLDYRAIAETIDLTNPKGEVSA
jgi:hypothetical protein